MYCNDGWQTQGGFSGLWDVCKAPLTSPYTGRPHAPRDAGIGHMVDA